jgi:mannose-6-phosphate isomerase-like protein (cupin superfamily)
MTVQNLSAQPPFITKDGSTIRSIETRSLPTSLAATHRGFTFYVLFPKSSVLDRTNAPVQNQSLAEARVPAGGRTERHYHKVAEELYFILEGAGEIELDGERRMVGPGDAILIPPGAWHTITATEPLRFLCCCAPPYTHDDTYLE